MSFAAWGAVSVVGRLGGGRRNEVLELRLGGERVVGRVSRRSVASLDWELDLLEFLSGAGFLVPAVVPTVDGRRQVDGVVVQRWLPGREPTADDWPAVASELRRLHSVTAGRPQRPDFRSTTELLTVSHGGDVDLSVMPAWAVAACRRAWAALTGPQAVVHGDPCAENVRVTAAGIGLLDWDEARVDHPDLDLADLPGSDLPYPVRAAIDAWEAAAGWQLEPDYARSRLARLARSD
ncbi:phosphotransferase [Actinophytocola sp.]|uniref:phosphotransferase enzyme family protein n=1 Tax=Actinophytocola sp. TaxID=1872138 RepID=UPI0025C26177|nr:phosphotransferase [Actinophytocola sp.]